MAERVVMTGGGAISSLGTSWDQIYHALRAQKNAVRYMQEWDQYPELDTRLAAPVDGFVLPDHYRARQKRSMGKVAQYGVRATELALESAGLLGNELLSNGEVGVSFGSSTGSSDAAVEFFGLLENKTMERVNSTTYLRMMSHTAAINISVYFGTTGRFYPTSSACTAGSQGIGYAYEAIKEGKQSVMIAGGAEELCPTQAAVFDVVFATSTKNKTPELSPRPFDVNRDGLVLGEGACTVILESLDHAQARGANILAEVIGFGTNTDGAHVVRPQQKTMEKVMHLALADAGINADQVDYISAHGTATEHGDIAESQATAAVFGSDIPISTLKGYTGHTLGSCGAFEAWASANMMQENWFAPTLNSESLDPRCALLDYITGEGRDLHADIIVSNNFAFGGVNTSLVLKRF